MPATAISINLIITLPIILLVLLVNKETFAWAAVER
jgi:hypothetical protein